jgi:hypothetical protein
MEGTRTCETLQFLLPPDPGKRELDYVAPCGRIEQRFGDRDQTFIGQVRNIPPDGVTNIETFGSILCHDGLEPLDILRLLQGVPDPSTGAVQAEDPMGGQIDHNHLVTNLAPSQTLSSLNLHSLLQLSPLPKPENGRHRN